MNQNLPDPHEKFVIPDHLSKVEFKKDTKVPNAGTFIIQREDHTMGNLIRCMLHRDEHVAFAGYRIPHPLKYEMLIRVQTDGSVQNNFTTQQPEVWGPTRAIRHALENLRDEFDDLITQFERECVKIEGEMEPMDHRGNLGAGMTPRLHY